MTALFDRRATEERRMWQMIAAGAQRALRPFLPEVTLNYAPWGTHGPYVTIYVMFAGMGLKIPLDDAEVAYWRSDPAVIASLVCDEEGMGGIRDPAAP